MFRFIYKQLHTVWTVVRTSAILLSISDYDLTYFFNTVKYMKPDSALTDFNTSKRLISSPN